MDRFIENSQRTAKTDFVYLKSNMDRFIDMPSQYIIANPAYLKSNMDRFIDADGETEYYLASSFKIQYG